MENTPVTQITDANGNCASIRHWGSEEAARASLKTLRNCKNCWNCQRCSDCSGCENCVDCSDCSDCMNCLDCLNCSDCLDCSSCMDCCDCLDREKGKKNKVDESLQPVIPVISGIHQAVYAAASAPAALIMENWHTCETTHCRAGWVITLAGEAGKALEEYWSTDHAAWLIYKASDPEIAHRPDFFCSNDDALVDMKRLADAERAKT